MITKIQNNLSAGYGIYWLFKPCDHRTMPGVFLFGDIMQEKKCSKCKENKLIKKFYSNKNSKDGLASWCKDCTLEMMRYSNSLNPEKNRKKASLWNKANPEQYRKRMQLWYKNNSEKAKKRSRLWYKNNPEKARKTHQLWIGANLERYRAIQRKTSNQYRSTLYGRLNRKISTAIRIALKGNKMGRGWEVLVGYTAEQLKIHLERQFVEGMTWDNYNKNGWHIDHIIPISVHNFEKPEDEDFKRCWSLKNLRPLWATDNLRKNDKLYKQFQPKLIFKS